MILSRFFLVYLASTRVASIKESRKEVFEGRISGKRASKGRAFRRGESRGTLLLGIEVPHLEELSGATKQKRLQ